MSNEAKCPFSGGALKPTVAGSPANAGWWPNQLNLKILHQHSPRSNPLGEAFDYAEAFKSLDLDAVVKDLHALMPVITERLSPYLALCTDDRNPLDIAEQGHLDYMIRTAIASGVVGATLIWTGIDRATGPDDVTDTGVGIFKGAMMVVPMALVIVSYLTLRARYRLDEATYARIVEEVRARNEEAAER